MNERLNGSLDYFLRANSQLLVIEAKNEDLTGVFIQLAIELIGLLEWELKEDLIFSNSLGVW